MPETTAKSDDKPLGLSWQRPSATRPYRSLHRTIEIASYDPQWPQMFEAEAARLTQVFGQQLIAIHHMGSTAVPGLPAKPIIDILPEVRDIGAIDALNDAMVELGYIPKGENGIPGRRYFSKDMADVRRYHVHVFQTGNPEVARHLDFVAYLRAYPAAAQAYSELKQKLADQFPSDIISYTEGKTELIVELEKRAALWKTQLSSISTSS